MLVAGSVSGSRCRTLCEDFMINKPRSQALEGAKKRFFWCLEKNNDKYEFDFCDILLRRIRECVIKS